tara:strand:- start:377 stop:613 length:237 start_codon:yes stop_codon:yes gene_type:complete
MINKVAKAVLKIIMPDVIEHFIRIFKLNKLVDYMELPNSADRKIEKLEVKNKAMTEKLKELENVVAKVKKLRAFKSIG